MKKKLKLSLIVLVVISGGIFIWLKIYNAPEAIIKNSIKYENSHDIDSLKKCYTSRLGVPYNTVENIKSKKIISISLVTEQSLYDFYINNSIEKYGDLTKDRVKIYSVNYKVEYEDDNKSPEDSGEYRKNYIVIKDSMTGSWKIDDIGE